MMKFKLEVSETFKKIVEVEADDLNSAFIKICKQVCEEPKVFTLSDRADLEVREYKK